MLEIGPYDYRPGPLAKRLGMDLLPFDPRRVETVLSRYHPQRFGERYARQLDRSHNLSVLLYATVTSIHLDDGKRFASGATVQTLAGNRFAVTAKFFVLATGGIENARLLLLSNEDLPAGLGNQNDLVGRFFVDHIWYPNGMILPQDQDPAKVQIYDEENPLEGGYGVRCHLALPESQTRELRIPQYRVELRVERSRWWFPAIRSAARLKRFANSLELENLTSSDVLNVIGDPALVYDYMTGDDDAPYVYGFNNYVEQVPNPDSRVRLTGEKDALGQNKVELNWRLSQLDKDGIVQAQRLIAQEVGRLGIGRMHSFVPESEERILHGGYGGNHHIGTTRMHADPKQGVVDADCRVHGTENVFIAGSSVFPTSGYPNPTLTIVALALRLADRLHLELDRL